jgi:signal transduction histidine kinase
MSVEANTDTTVRSAAAAKFLSGGGEMGRLIRALDWSRTPLGAPDRWSPALRMMTSFLLANRFPLLLWWGPEYIQIYNDAYRPVLGTKHPQFLGCPVRECWSEILDVIGPLIDTPFRGGPATWMDDIELEVNRHGYLEESHFTIAYSPVPDESAPHGIGGVLATVHEITEKVIGQRRVTILSELAARVADAKSAEQACVFAAEVLRGHPKDASLTLMYLAEPGGARLRLTCVSEAESDPEAPQSFDLDDPASEDPFALRRAFQSEATQIVERVEAPSLVTLPIKSTLAHSPSGVLVLGAGNRIALDPQYIAFFELVCGQIASGVANARSYEAERRRAESLAEIDRAKTVFFSNVSHEFRTPLTLMLGPVDEALASTQLAGQTREQLQLVRRNSLRLLRLVNSLLEFSRLEAGRMRAHYEPTDLAALTRDIASMFRSTIEAAGLQYSVDCQDFTEPVFVDREMWEKIVLNLLSNALKFTLEGWIRVRLHREGELAVLEVSDSGVGIPEEHMPRLFERFHRVERAGGRTQEGTGIGLALVHELVKLHDGDAQARSETGRGTAIRIRLHFGKQHLSAEHIVAASTPTSPAVAAQAYIEEARRWVPDATPADSPEPEALSPTAQRGDPRFKATFGARILLADDNADMRDYLRALLAPMYHVETVADGRLALAAAHEQRPDLVLSDVMMPRLDGIALTKALREDRALQDVPIILLSARAGEEAHIGGLDAGADDYLVKPFSARELIARVGAILERRGTQEAADRQRNEFLAMLAHELRNPLAPIRNAGELLARIHPDDGPTQALTEMLRRQVTVLTRLVDDLLDVSRITQGRIVLQRGQVLLGDIVSQALETVEPLIRERRHKISVVSSGPLRVNGDATRLVQCVANILTNAARYTEPEGEIRIEVREQGDDAVLRVTDSGIGIPADLLPHVFDLFVQSERTLDRAQGGLGIGLALVKRLINMHDGLVSASSPGVGRGSTFEIRLPLSNLGGESDEHASIEVEPVKVLIVDDNVDAATSLAMLLQLEGHEVEVAYSSLDALARVGSAKPALVLLDIGLPDIDGYELARRIRLLALSPRPRLVALTGYGQAEDKQRAKAAGFDQHLVKPLEFPTLRKTLAALRERRL